MREYPKELEKDLVKALAKLMGFNHIHMESGDFKSFLIDLENFCVNNDLSEIFEETVNLYLMAMENAIREVLK